MYFFLISWLRFSFLKMYLFFFFMITIFFSSTRLFLYFRLGLLLTYGWRSRVSFRSVLVRPPLLGSKVYSNAVHVGTSLSHYSCPTCYTAFTSPSGVKWPSQILGAEWDINIMSTRVAAEIKPPGGQLKIHAGSRSDLSGSGPMRPLFLGWSVIATAVFADRFRVSSTLYY